MTRKQKQNANSDKELIGGSVPATEHSVMCMGGIEKEVDTYKRLITEVYPNGIVSIVSDTWDYWGIFENVLIPLKEIIMNRNGKVVIRPDSGNPVDIICGNDFRDLTPKCRDIEELKDWCAELILDRIQKETAHGKCGESIVSQIFKYYDEYYECEIEITWNRYDKQYYYQDGYEIINFKKVEITKEQKGSIECLWDIFGGQINSKGYKQLDSHIGLIYGDSITIERCKEICERLKKKGFASTNVVLGIGSYTYQFNTRDTLGFAMKSTYGEINGIGHEIFKTPKTDNGIKNSAKGLLCVDENMNLIECVSKEKENEGLLKTIFINGELRNEISLSKIRENLSAKL